MNLLLILTDAREGVKKAKTVRVTKEKDSRGR